MIVPITTDMVNCFLNRQEAYQIRMLAYKRFNVPIPTEPPKQLYLLFIDRATKNRGIRNQMEVIAYLKNYTGVWFVRSH